MRLSILFLLCLTAAGCSGTLGSGDVDGGTVPSDGSMSTMDGQLSDSAADVPVIIIDGGECTVPADCPAAPTCQESASCESHRCVYTPSATGTACGAPVGCAVFSCNGAGTCEMAPVICNDPPVDDVPTSCPVGTTFSARLGGACGGACNPASGVCEYAMVDVACPPRGGDALPVTYAWQAKIREYLATLTAADFTSPPGTEITYSATGPEHDAPAREQVAWWLASGTLTDTYTSVPLRGFPGTFDTQPSEFTLAQIEQDAPGYHTQVGWRGLATDYAAWLTTWDFPGNGYRHSKPQFLRAFAFTASDLIITTHRYIAQNNWDVFMFPGLPYHGYVGKVAHSEGFLDATPLEQCAIAAYDVGTRAYLERIAEVAPTWSHDPNGDIVAMGLRGLAYISQSLGDAEAIDIAHTAAAQLIANNAAEGGYWDHFNCTGCYDAQYEGTTLVALREAAIVSGWSEVRTNTVNLMRTISLLTLPEPGGQWYGPSHFSPATSAPPPSNTGDTPSVLMPNLDFGDSLMFSLFQGRNGLVLNWPDLAGMQTSLEGRLGSGISGTDASTFETEWDYTGHYSYGMPFFSIYKPEWYDTLETLIANPSDPRRLPPFARTTNFAEAIADDFVAVKLGDSGIIVHTGNVSRDANPNGFGGGELSAFWTRNTGSAILGWSRGGQNPRPNTWTGSLRWQGWKHWAAHALSGVVDGHPFSSARLSTITRSHTLSTSGATVNASGDLNTNQSDPEDGLASALAYSRVFDIGGSGTPDGVRITTSVGPLPSGVSELYEILPIWDHEYAQLPDGFTSPDCSADETSVSNTMVTVVFMQGSSSMTPTDTTPVSNVTSVVIARFGHSVVVAFDTPHTVSLGEQTCTGYQWDPVGRNLLIELPHGAGTSPSISYTIRPGS